MPGGVAARSSRLSWTPLALTLGLHLLLVLAWRLQEQPEPASAAPELLMDVMPVRPPAAPARVRPSAPRAAPKAPSTTRADARRRAPPASDAPAPTEPQPAAAPAPPEPVEPAAREAPLTLEGEDLLAAGKRRAVEIDRQLRKGKSGVPDEANTPWSRFREGVAAAHVDRSPGALLEAYESPDGVVIYRTTQWGKQTCRMTGSVNFGPGRAGGGNVAGDVSCPKGVRWRRL